MSYLSADEIITIISEYIHENIYNYAIMIDGIWGSGKTHFVIEQLVPALRKDSLEREEIYVSLYGVETPEDISKQLLSSIVEKKVKKKLNPFLTTASKVAFDLVGNILENNTTGKSDEIISPFLDYSKYYFIFDDLERCSMQIVEVLGYINHFVEQNNAKVLIIANESEIGTIGMHENLEFKYYLALQDKVSWPKKENKNLSHYNNSTPQWPIDFTDLQNHVNYLFNANELYLKTKEKLVGRTILYQPHMEDIVPVIIEKCCPNIDSKLLFVPDIIEIFTSKQCYNLRTLQFALLFYSKILSYILDDYDEKNSVFIDCMKEVLLSAINVSIWHKNGKANYGWDKDAEYGYMFFGEDSSNLTKIIFNQTQSFKFVHDYVYSSECDKERIKSVLSNYINEQTKNAESKSDPYNILQNYWEMEDDIVEDLVQHLYENVKDKKYNSGLYKHILSLLYLLKGIGIEPVPISHFVDSIQQFIIDGASLISYEQPQISNDSPCYDEYVACINKLIELERLQISDDTASSINAIFKVGSGWGNTFLEYYREHRNEIMSRRGFLCYFDVESCYATIRDSSVKDLSDFRRGLASLYDFSNLHDFFSADIGNFIKLRDLIQNTDFTGKMKCLNIEQLLGLIQSILERLKYTAQGDE